MENLVGGMVGGLLLVASLLMGAVVALESILIVVLLTVPVVNALRRLSPWRRAADRKAADLLRHVLTRDEFAGLCLHGYLEVRSPAWPERTYRVPRARGTIDVYEGGRYHSTLCIAPVVALPDDDVVLAHRLMIQADEPSYLATANRVQGARWEERAPLRAPSRPSDWPNLLRLLGAAVLATALATLLLHLADLPLARDAVLAVAVGWPVVIAIITVLGGLAVVLMGAVSRPRRGDRRTLPGRRLA